MSQIHLYLSLFLANKPNSKYECRVVERESVTITVKIIQKEHLHLIDSDQAMRWETKPEQREIEFIYQYFIFKYHSYHRYRHIAALLASCLAIKIKHVIKYDKNVALAAQNLMSHSLLCNTYYIAFSLIR